MYFTCAGNISNIRICRNLQEIVKELHRQYKETCKGAPVGDSLHEYVGANLKFHDFLIKKSQRVWFQADGKDPVRLPKEDILEVAKQLKIK